MEGRVADSGYPKWGTPNRRLVRIRGGAHSLVGGFSSHPAEWIGEEAGDVSPVIALFIRYPREGVYPSVREAKTLCDLCSHSSFPVATNAFE